MGSARSGSLRSFLSSYSAHRAGRGHTLLIVFNGFGSESELAPYNRLLSDFEYTSMFLHDPVQDIDAYFTASENHAFQYYCFLNSYSRILADDWLTKLYDHASDPTVGLVGATGSWESMYTNYRAECDMQKGTWLAKRARALHNHRFKLLRFKWYFRGFPNHHLRTNAFMIPRELIMKLKHRPILNKMDAYRFESGRDGLTGQVLKMHRRVLVVDSEGNGFDIDQWDRSATFKQGNQEKLLIADNQTDRYAAADPASKNRISRDAWKAGDSSSSGERP